MPLPSFLLMLLAVISTAGLTIWLMVLSKAPIAMLGLIAVIATAAVQLFNATRSCTRPQKPAPNARPSSQ